MLEHRRQLLGERQDDGHDMLGDGHRLHAAGIADDDAAREQVLQAERLNRDCRAVHPAQFRRAIELGRGEDPRVGGIAISQPLRPVGLGRGLDEFDVWEASAECGDTVRRDLPLVHLLLDGD